MLDLLIIGGRLLDFKRGLVEENLGIKDGKISYMGVDFPQAKEVLELEAQIVSPGFIDIHMHEEDFVLSQGDYDIAKTMLAMGVTTAVAGNCGNNRQSLEAFLSQLNSSGSPINYMSYIGHNFLREQVGNRDTKAPSTREQTQKMRSLVNEAINLGALGISYGFEYCSGGSFEEAIGIAEDLKGKEGILLTGHYRYDGDRALESIQEMAEISKALDLPFLISHLSSCSAFGYMKESLDLIRDYREKGVKLFVDAYPYTAFSTYIGSDVFEEGCLERWGVDYKDIQLTQAPYENMRCTEEIFMDARENHPKMLAIAHVMREEEIAMAMADPMVIVASDGIYSSGKGHPRGAGTFPRFISKYLRDEGLMEFVEGMKKITLMPAETLGLSNKGRLEEGCDADLCIFNYSEIRDQADFAEAQKPPLGISHVLIDGKFALRDGTSTEGRFGKFIARKNGS